MARRNGNLAGLAALAALGYMATRGRDEARGVGQGRDESVESETRLQTPENRRQTPARTEDDRDIGMISGASPSGLYRNTESGDLFSMNRPEAAPSVSRSNPEEAPSTSRAKSPRRNAAGDYTRKMGRMAGEADAYNQSREAAAAPAETPTRASTSITLGTPIRPDPDAPSIYAGPEAWAEYRRRKAAGMKKGGAVKADVYKDANAAVKGAKKRGEKSVTFKLASGGMTASKRADGIAQRGKTRGRLV